MEESGNNQTLAAKHQKSLARMYNIIEQAIDELEELQQCKDASQEWQERWNQTFGARETVAGMAIKLTNALIKLIPMENKVMSVMENKQDHKLQDISQEDVEIIRRYLKKIDEAKSAFAKPPLPSGEG